MKVSVEFQELDRKQRIKRIIAREGLIFLGIIIISYFLGEYGYRSFWVHIAPGLDPVYHPYPYPTLGSSIRNCIIALYAVYLSYWLIRLLIRFVIWAVRTLKEKE